MSQLHESKNDIFSLLPLKIYRHNLTGNFIYSPLHWHRSLELTITLTGSVRFNTGSNNFDFGESDWLFVNSCELHSCSYVSPTDSFTGISILISLAFIEKWIGKNVFFYNPDDPIVTVKIRNLALDFYNLDESNPKNRFELMSKLFELLSLLTEYCIKPDASTLPRHQETTLSSQLTEYIEQHYRQDLSLNEVAEHFKYSPSYFSRLFKESLGVNFHSYLNFVRIGHAAEQLSNGYDNLTACAYENGFPNVKSFISTFKSLYGCTPSAFISSSKH